MASINFLLLTESETTQIYVRVKAGKGKDWKPKTGLFINSKYWNKSKGMPKQSNSDLKILSKKLRDLSNDIMDWINESSNHYKEDLVEVIGNSINKDFSKEDKSFNTFVAKYINFEDTQKLSIASRKKYITLQNKLLIFDPENRYNISDVDLKFRDKFITFLRDSEKLGDNTTGRYLKVIVTFILSAEKNGYTISSQFKNFKGFTVKAEKVILSFEEIEIIKNTSYESDFLNRAKHWLIISCYTGQRVSDLLRMNTGMINEIQGYHFITLTQIKTGKIVHIPIHNEVREILDIYNGFPPLFSNKISSNATEYNELLKIIAKNSGLNAMTLGNLRDEKEGRFIKKEYEKWRLISSHVGRRSFATNFYAQEKYPTPLLMAITGHSTEKMFLEYIGKKPVDYALQLAKLWGNEVK